jgi:hypothetical protein
VPLTVTIPQACSPSLHHNPEGLWQRDLSSNMLGFYFLAWSSDALFNVVAFKGTCLTSLRSFVLHVCDLRVHSDSPFQQISIVDQNPECQHSCREKFPAFIVIVTTWLEMMIFSYPKWFCSFYYFQRRNTATKFTFSVTNLILLEINAPDGPSHVSPSSGKAFAVKHSVKSLHCNQPQSTSQMHLIWLPILLLSTCTILWE